MKKIILNNKKKIIYIVATIITVAFSGDILRLIFWMPNNIVSFFTIFTVWYLRFQGLNPSTGMGVWIVVFILISIVWVIIHYCSRMRKPRTQDADLWTK